MEATAYTSPWVYHCEHNCISLLTEVKSGGSLQCAHCPLCGGFLIEVRDADIASQV